MTDLLLKPEDTGELPAVETITRAIEPGQRTENLKPYVDGLAPALRRPTAVLALLTPRTDPPPPAPLPNPGPPPAPTGDIVWEYADPSEKPPYVGRHRRPSRWDWLTVPLTLAVQRIGRAL